MLRSIALVEDSEAEVEKLRAFFKRYEEEHEDRFRIVHFANAETFLGRYTPVYDIVLMDIMLPGMNGMDAAARLREMDISVTLMFVTNMAQFAVKGYEVDAFDFIVKPITYANFRLKLQRTLNRLNSQRDTQIMLTLSDRMVRIPTSQIQYIEISKHDLKYHTTSGDYTVYGSLKSAEAALNPKMFARCNSCYLVNLNFVLAVDGYTVTVGEDELQISRSRRKPFIQQLNDFLGGGV